MLPRTPEPEIIQGNDLALIYQNSPVMEISHEAFMKTLDEVLPKKYFSNEAQLKIVDVACGSGQMISLIANRFKGALVYGFDASKEMVCLARKNCKHLYKDVEDYILMQNVNELHSHPHKYSLLLCNGSIHHFADPVAFWNGIKNITNESAFLIVQDLRRPETEEILKKIVKSAYQENQSNELGYESDPLSNDFRASLRAAYTVREVSLQLEQADLSHLTVEEVGNRRLRIYGNV